MGFLAFKKTAEEKSIAPPVKGMELPPVPHPSARDLELPPLPEGSEKGRFQPIAEENGLPGDVPQLDIEIEDTGCAELPELKDEKTAQMDEAPEFPNLEDYMEKEGIKEAIPPLEINGQEMKPADVEIPPLRITPQKPMFLTLSSYKSVLRTIDDADVRMDESINALLRMIDIKVPLDKEYERLSEILRDAERRIEYVDKLFFEKY